MTEPSISALMHRRSTVLARADDGEAGPVPTYLDTGSGGPEDDLNDRDTELMPRILPFSTWDAGRPDLPSQDHC